MIGVSSCLAGKRCTYKGSHHQIDKIKELVDSGQAVMICPEVLGGMSIPRDPCEIVGDKVLSTHGEDRTKEYQVGANKALEILKRNKIKVVLLKSKSPSCGKGFIYDGSFSRTLIKRDGMTTKLLEQNGIIVYNEDTFDEFLKDIEEE